MKTPYQEAVELIDRHPSTGMSTVATSAFTRTETLP
jgi:hypothetical protein